MQWKLGLEFIGREIIFKGHFGAELKITYPYANHTECMEGRI